MSRQSEALAVVRDVVEEFDGRKPLRTGEWHSFGTSFGKHLAAYCPACSSNMVKHSDARFCRGKKRRWWWPWGERCDEDRAHLHVKCASCGWFGLFASANEDA